MIDFSLSEEQKNLLQKARDFATNEIKPVAIEYDKEGTYPEHSGEAGLLTRVESFVEMVRRKKKKLAFDSKKKSAVKTL